MEKDVLSSIGEKRHVETPSGRDVCQVPCRTTSSFLCDTFFRPACTPTAACRWKMAPRYGCSWGSVILGAVLSRDFQDCLHAGQPLDISSSIYSCSAMVVISFLSILGNSFRMLRLVRPRSLVTWCSSVRVLILSDFITRSSRFSLCTSQLGWQGMTDLLEAVGEIGIRVVLRFSGLRSDLRALISMTVFFYGGLISCFLIT